MKLYTIALLLLGAGAIRATVTPLFGCWCNSSCPLNNLPAIAADHTRFFLGYRGNQYTSALPAAANPQTTNNQFSPGACLDSTHGQDSVFSSGMNPQILAADLDDTCLASGVTWTLFSNDLVINAGSVSEAAYCEHAHARHSTQSLRTQRGAMEIVPTKATEAFLGYLAYVYNGTEGWALYESLVTNIEANLSPTYYANYAGWIDDDSPILRFGGVAETMDVLVDALTITDYRADIYDFAKPSFPFSFVLSDKSKLLEKFVNATMLLDCIQNANTYIHIRTGGEIDLRAMVKVV